MDILEGFVVYCCFFSILESSKISFRHFLLFPTGTEIILHKGPLIKNSLQKGSRLNVLLRVTVIPENLREK